MTALLLPVANLTKINLPFPLGKHDGQGAPLNEIHAVHGTALLWEGCLLRCQ
jgi:hypothetical protein